MRVVQGLTVAYVLGRAVAKGASQHLGVGGRVGLVRGRCRAAGRTGGHGQAKVCHAGVAQAVKENVAGLDVPVDQARLRLLRKKAQSMATVAVAGVSENLA